MSKNYIERDSDKRAYTHIRSIKRGTKVIDCMARNGGKDLALSDISSQVNISKSTVFNILATLESVGYVIKDVANGKYSLGIKLFEIGRIVHSSFEIIDLARPYLEQLSEEFHETVHLAILEDDQVLYLDKISCAFSIGMMSTIGWRGPAYCTGIGKVLLSRFTESEIDDYLQRVEMEKMTENTIINPIEFKEHLKKIYRDGISYDNEEIEKGLTCIAVPVYNWEGEIEAAISISGPTSRMMEQGLYRMEKRLKEMGQLLSTKMGYEG